MSSQHQQIWDPLSAWPAARRPLWAALTLLTCIVLGSEFLSSLRPGPKEGVDFFQEWASAKNLQQGLPIYTDLRTTAELYLGYTAGPNDRFLITRNAHPPTSVLVALPFALLDYPDAMLAWNLLSLAALAVSIGLIGQALGLKADAWAILPATTLALLCNPLRQQINHGQLNLLLLLLITAMWVADRKAQLRLAGILLGTATAIKLFPGLFFLYFALRRRWTVVAFGVAALAGLTGLTVAILGVESYTSYVGLVVPQVSVFRNWWLNASLAGFWTKWFDTGAVSSTLDPALPSFLPPIVHLPLVAKYGLLFSSIAVMVAWAAIVLRARTRAGADWAFGLTLTVMLLISPLTWDHYFLLLLLPIVQLWLALSNMRRPRMTLLILVVCLWVSPLAAWRAFIPTSGVTPGDIGAVFRALVAVSLQFFALLGVFILGVRFGRSQDFSSPAGTTVPR